MAEEQTRQAELVAAGVCFCKGGKVYSFLPAEFPVELGDFVVVETQKGVDIGEVVELKTEPEPGESPPTKKLIRPATSQDVRRRKQLYDKEEQALGSCEKKIAEHSLPMKLIDASYTLDGKQLTFSFVAEGRVDFRELVKDLAQTFRCRIELRQVGVRDQAKMLGGLGPCGRPLCCAAFLRDFSSIGIRLAKDQGLSLNPTKVSGACDRLMCCLRFEHERYAEMAQRLPKVGEQVNVGQVAGEVIQRNLLVGTIKVQTPEGTEAIVTEEELASPPPPGGRSSRDRGHNQQEAGSKQGEAPAIAQKSTVENQPEAKPEESPNQKRGRRRQPPRARRHRSNQPPTSPGKNQP